MIPLRNNKSFLDSICSFKLGLFNAISEVSRILRIRLFLVLQTKFSRKTCDLSFLSIVLQVQNLWRLSHILPIAFLRYVSFRRCMFAHKHTHSYVANAGCGFLLFSLKSCFTFFVIHFILNSYELLVSS